MEKVTTQLINKLSNKLKQDGIGKVVVGAIIFSESGQVLLLERLPSEFKGGLVELPSGNIEAEEGIIEGLGREVDEETALKVAKVIGYVGSFDYYSSSGKKVRQLNFVVTVGSG
ncbi:MAG: NUDIX hydrolase, partial [Patescibacteria group bacterium]|nr:NUDIX hydrolase [Patescibacteria group bacterium]